MTILNFVSYPAKRWGYEKAFVESKVIVCDRTDEWDQIQKFFDKLFGKGPQNKVTYLWEEGMSITMHDNHVYIGTGVRAYDGGELSCPDEWISLNK